MNATLSKEKVFFIKLFMLASVIMFMFTSVFVFAKEENKGTSNGDPGAAYDNLTKEVATYYKTENNEKPPTYEVEGGGYLSYTELFASEGSSYDLDEYKFNTLTNKGQNEAVKDIAYASNAVKDKNQKDGDKTITDDTVSNWWSHLQNKKGVGTRFLNQVLADTKPDFVTASKWYKPFSGPIGTLLAFGSIIAMALVGLVMAADILYITVPPFRLFVDDKGTDGKVQISKIFSHAAIHAVKTVEEGGDSAGNKAALGIYFKMRVWELILLAICLLYLVNGKIYTLVGYILDMLSGITG